MFEAKYKALSIKQPWAWLICAGYKDIENRNWSTKFRGRIHVHTGQRGERYGLSLLAYQALAKEKPDLVLGAIIGEVDIVDCVTKSDSPWFIGDYGFALANPVLYDKPIKCKGKLGFFTPELTEVNVFRLA